MPKEEDFKLQLIRPPAFNSSLFLRNAGYVEIVISALKSFEAGHSILAALTAELEIKIVFRFPQEGEKA